MEWKMSTGASKKGGDISVVSSVSADHATAADVSESIADMSCDSDVDVFANDINQTFTLTSPFVTSMTRETEIHADGMMSSADNRQQVVSAVSAAGEQQAPVSGLMTSATSAASQRQPPLRMSLAGDQQALVASVSASVTTQRILPAAVSCSPSCSSSGICCQFLSTVCSLFFA